MDLPPMEFLNTVQLARPLCRRLLRAVRCTFGSEPL